MPEYLLRRLQPDRPKASGARLTRNPTRSLAGTSTPTSRDADLSFVDKRSGLTGKPDYLRRERNGGLIARHVAAEVKPSRRRDTPYAGDVLQLLAYVLLTMAHFGSRAARYGYLAYAERTWRIEADEDALERVRETADAMRAAHQLQVVHRGHHSRCAACGFRDQCSQGLVR